MKQNIQNKFPKGWEIKELGAIAKVTSGGTPKRENNLYWGGNIPWVTTSLINFNEIENAEEYITEDGLKNSSAKLFPSGTILMALYGQGVTRGKTALLNIDATTNQACAAILLDENQANRKFIFQYLISKYDDIRNLSNTGNQENLSGELVKSLKLPLPPLKEQAAIAALLSTWDTAIQKTTTLITQKQNQKKWLMQTLLSGKGKGWEEIELGELLDYEQPTKYLVKDTNYDDNFTTPVLTAGKTFILGYTNEEDGIYLGSPVIIFDDFTTASRFVDFPFKVKSSAMKLLHAKKGVNLKFVYEVMQSLKYVVGGHERHWISKFAYLTILVPKTEKQTRIAQILQTADKEINLLKSKAQKLKEQKKGLMQQLLTGKKRLKV